MRKPKYYDKMIAALKESYEDTYYTPIKFIYLGRSDKDTKQSAFFIEDVDYEGDYVENNEILLNLKQFKKLKNINIDALELLYAK